MGSRPGRAGQGGGAAAAGTAALEWEWYCHAGHWQNRLIHGDSAAVMQSLIAKDRLRGGVQMIYFDHRSHTLG